MIFDEQRLRDLIADVVREVLRAELATAPGRDDFLTVVAAAQVAAVHPTTVREWIGEGKLGRYYAGARLRVRRSELEALLAAAPADTPPEGADLVELGRSIVRRRTGVR